MIDTDKYEGHTPGPWRVGKTSGIVTEAGMPVTALTNQRFQTMTLMADAPLLLAEVKRLREALINVQRSLVWDEEDRTMLGEPITLEALFTQVEQVRSDIMEMIE